MQHGQEIFRLFGPAEEQVPVAVEPRMGALDHPAPGPLPRGFCLFLLAPGTDVSRVAVGRHDAADLVVVVARV